MEVRRDLLGQLLDHSRQLYSLPAVALEVLELTNEPQVDTARLKDCIERDPALTSKVLRVVNSSLFGLGRRVSDLNQALAVLGTKPLKMLVLGFGLPEPLFAGLARDVLNQYWRHTLTRAVAARDLSQRLWHLPGDELFVAGLLADLGRLVLIQGLGRPYVEMLRKADWPREDVRALERRLIGFDHVQLTAGLIRQWGLPDALVAAVQLPETLSAEARPDVKVLYLAEKIAELLADDRAEALADLLKAAGAVHRFSEGQLTALTDSLEERVRQLAEVLSLDLPLDLPYSEVLARAYSQLASVAASASGELLRCQQVANRLGDFADRDEARNLSAAAAKFHSAQEPRIVAPIGSVSVAGSVSRPVRAALAPTVAPPRGEDTVGRSVVRATLPVSQPVTTVRGVRPLAPPDHGGVSTVPLIHPALAAKIMSASSVCRQKRQELSLLLVEIDAFEQIAVLRGSAGAERVREALFEICRLTDAIGQTPLELTEARFAVVLPGCDRPAAADAGHVLLRQACSSPDCGGAVTVSIGASTVAVPAKNFDPIELVQSAERCLRACQLSGGNCFKSIEAY
ncbi:MAG TPA: HDOD domain-containing protein [Pirellulales bacterium]|jgi:HD-like signal output (HDOD) protein/GGDEF domain-containing protein|nr:HDOD domain-containing protein [Pirellulales bacterium]